MWLVYSIRIGHDVTAIVRPDRGGDDIEWQTSRIIADVRGTVNMVKRLMISPLARWTRSIIRWAIGAVNSGWHCLDRGLAFLEEGAVVPPIVPTPGRFGGPSVVGDVPCIRDGRDDDA